MSYRLFSASGTRALDEEFVALNEIYRKIYASPEELAAELKLSVEDSLAVVKLAAGATVRVTIYLDRILGITGVEGLEVFVGRPE